MNLSKTLFWDMKRENLSFEKDADFIIPKVFMKGTLDDYFEVVNFYGKEKCKEVLLQTRYLDKKTLAFCETIFETNKEEFRCYKLKQSIPPTWNH